MTGGVDAHVHPTRFDLHGAELARRNGIDYSVRGLLAEMDGAGIRHALFLASRLAPDPESAVGETLAAHRESGGRLLPTGTVDPSAGGLQVERAIAAWQAADPPIHAIKLYPGYRPYGIAEERVRPVLRWAEAHRVPVVVHQGDTSDPDGLIRYARPIDLDEVAVAHRGLRFVLCHLGNPWVEEAAEVVYKNPNVWADVSGLLSPIVAMPARRKSRMARRVGQALATVGDSGKLLFGSGWPVCSIAEARSLLDDLALDPAEREAILGANAHRVFRIAD